LGADLRSKRRPLFEGEVNSLALDIRSSTGLNFECSTRPGTFNPSTPFFVYDGTGQLDLEICKVMSPKSWQVTAVRDFLAKFLYT
jgi:hypothetical protein